MKVCDESLYHEIAVIYRFLHLYERMETMEGEALDFITRDFDAWKRRREQIRQVLSWLSIPWEWRRCPIPTCWRKDS